jgi:hypothetical protein
MAAPGDAMEDVSPSEKSSKPDRGFQVDKSKEVVDSGSLKQASDPHENHRTNKGNNNRSDYAATRPNSQHSKNPASEHAAQNTENDIDENTIATTFHHLTGKPTSD